MEDASILVELTETTERSKNNERRITKLEANQEELKSLATSTAVMAQRLGIVETNVGDIKESVETLKSKSGKMFDGMIEKILWLVIGGVIAFVFSQVGINL